MIPSTIFCTNCGTANRKESVFCFACGQPLQNRPADQPRPFPRASDSPHAYSHTTGKLPPHSVLKQRYRILARVGNGGFGAVYKAEDMQFGDRLVAIKEMNRRGSDEQGATNAAEAFKREAMLLANLKHPALPSIYDHFLEAGRWYLVMDFIAGETLESLLERVRRFRVEDVLRIGIQLSDVLNYLHSNRPPIIFRDLKPANIIMTPRGHTYLIDFGLAHLFDPTQAGNSGSFGSPGYAAPEQYESLQTTERADIYSLGATLHQLLTGIHPALRPFEFAPLRSVPGTPLADLGVLIARMLELSPERRPASMAVVLQELEGIANQIKGMRGTSGSVFQHPGNTSATSLPRSSGVYSPAASVASQVPSTLASPSSPLAPATPAPIPSTPGRMTPPAASRNPSSLSGTGTAAPPTGTLLCLYRGHRDEVNGLAWSPNGSSLASVSSDGEVHLWDAATASAGQVYHSGRKPAKAVDWSPDGSRVAIGYAGDKRNPETLHVIIAQTGERIFSFSGSGGFWNTQDDRTIYALAWSLDGSRIAWGGGESKVDVWDAQLRRQLVSYKGHTSTVYVLAWSADNRQIASSGADDAIHVWDALTGKNAGTYFKHSGIVSGLAWSSNGQRIATASHDKTALVWNAITGTTLTTYRGHASPIHTLAWSPDGSRIATGSRDGQVHIWDANKGTALSIYSGHTGAVNAVRWSPDGKQLASASADKTVHVWRAV